MSYIGSQPADQTSGAKPRDEFVGTGSQTNFTLSQEVPGGFESAILVVVDNVLQQPISSYTIQNNNTLVFSEAPASGSFVYVLHQGTATYNMIPVVGSVTPDKLSDNLRNFTIDTFTGNGATVAYTLTDTPASANAILVFVDGVMQTRTTNYTLAGNVVTFTGAPDTGSPITVVHLGFTTVSRTVVPDGAITTAKLSSGAPTWDTSGNLFIGTGSVAIGAFAGTYTDGTIVDYITGTGRITVGGSDGFKIRNGGPSAPVDLVAVDSSGNVGIGTSSPTSTLDVRGVSGITTTSGGNTARIVSAAAGTYFGATTNAPVIFQVNSGEAMRLNTNSELLLGTTTSPTGVNRIGIVNQGQVNYAIAIQNSNTSSDDAVGFFNSSGTRVGAISFTTSATSYGTSSDYRLKENIQPMQNALGVVAQLNPVTYTWKADGSDGQGFIAHELQAVVPDCVTGEKDAVDAEGKPVYQGIDTSFLVATLCKAIQELEARLAKLEA